MKKLFGSQKPKAKLADNTPSRINLVTPTANQGTSSEASTQITEGTVGSADEIDEGFAIISPDELRRAGMRDLAINKNTNSFYQQCLVLRNRLLRVYGFAPYLALIDEDPELSRLDIVRRLWHTFAQGTSLCYLYNLLDLPSSEKLNPSNLIITGIPYDNIRTMKTAVAAFVMGIQRLKDKGMWPEYIETFSVTELTDIDKMDMNGFVKVVATTSHLLEKLPEDVWISEIGYSLNSARFERSDPVRNDKSTENIDGGPETGYIWGAKLDNTLKELIETERKYLQELEAMQNFAHNLTTQGILDQDTVQLLFPGFKTLLNFQRKFSIELEHQYELPLEQQRWGLCFSTNEANFAVYEAYCVNYIAATELVRAEEHHLKLLSHLIDSKSELPTLLIKPVLRICSYPIILQSLQDHYPKTHEYYHELVEGVVSSKRIADKANRALVRAERSATVKVLSNRVQDWKGHDIDNFGDLLLDDVFTVTKLDVDRIYHVFLFEKILLCCKEDIQVAGIARRGGSLVKKHIAENVQPDIAARKRTTPLLLKGRIFLNNVTEARLNSQLGPHAVQLWWKAEGDLEFCILRCGSADQANEWQRTITQLVQEIQSKRNEKFTSHTALGRPSAQSNSPDQSEEISSTPSSDREYFNLAPMVPPKDLVKSSHKSSSRSRQEDTHIADQDKITRPNKPLVELDLLRVPGELKAITPFVMRAQEVQREDVIIAYYCIYYAVQTGIGAKTTQENSKAYMALLMTTLERMKDQLRACKEISSDEAAVLYIEKFALKIFRDADNEDREGGRLSPSVNKFLAAKRFLAAINFLQLLELFGDEYVDRDLIHEKINYAKQKASSVVILDVDAYPNDAIDVHETSESSEVAHSLSSQEELDSTSQPADFTQTSPEQSERSQSASPVPAVDGLPELEKLMQENPPQDLTGQVTIPDFRRPIYGGFAAVHEGVWNGKPVAVKVLKATKNLRRPAPWEASMERRLFREINVWSAISHPNIAEFLGFATEFSDFTAMISTWCEFGTAKDYLAEHDIAMQDRVYLVQDVADGLEYLHRLKIIHGDLKPTNILVDDKHVARLCDFGLVRLDDWQGPAGMTTTSPYTGTERYKAPELFITMGNSHPVATSEGDIWALGCIALEFIESRIPYGQYNNSYNLTKAIENGEPPASRPVAGSGNVFSQHLWDVSEACWRWFPEDRLKINDVVEQLAQLSKL